MKVKVQSEDVNPWGVKFDFSNWTVIEIEKGLQFHDLEIGVGSQLLSLNRISMANTHAHDAMKNILLNGNACQMTFLQAEVKSFLKYAKLFRLM